MNMVCKSCGSQVQYGAKYCTECGAKLPSIEDIPNISYYASSESSRNLHRDYQPPKKKKSHWFLWLLLLLLIAALALSLYFTRNVYTYSTYLIQSELTYSDQDINSFLSVFKDSYLYTSDGNYYVINLLSGLGFSSENITDEIDSGTNIDFSVEGNYAYIIFSDPNTTEKITISYYKSTITERFFFLSRIYPYYL